MASKENQEALDWLKHYEYDNGGFFEELQVDVRFDKRFEILQQAIDRLEALEEKQKPKEPQLEGDGYADGCMIYDTAICSNCGKIICEDGEADVNWGNDYCHKCGQRLSWEFEDESSC